MAYLHDLLARTFLSFLVPIQPPVVVSIAQVDVNGQDSGVLLILVVHGNSLLPSVSRTQVEGSVLQKKNSRLHLGKSVFI